MTHDFRLVLWLLAFSSLGICATPPEEQDKHSVDRSSATIPEPLHGVTVADGRDRDIRTRGIGGHISLFIITAMTLLCPHMSDPTRFFLHRYPLGISQ